MVGIQDHATSQPQWVKVYEGFHMLMNAPVKKAHQVNHYNHYHNDEGYYYNDHNDDANDDDDDNDGDGGGGGG